jgi:hypothetical protein
MSNFAKWEFLGLEFKLNFGLLKSMINRSFDLQNP